MCNVVHSALPFVIRFEGTDEKSKPEHVKCKGGGKSGVKSRLKVSSPDEYGYNQMPGGTPQTDM